MDLRSQDKQTAAQAQPSAGLLLPAPLNPQRTVALLFSVLLPTWQLVSAVTINTSEGEGRGVSYDRLCTEHKFMSEPALGCLSRSLEERWA